MGGVREWTAGQGRDRGRGTREENSIVYLTIAAKILPRLEKLREKRGKEREEDGRME